MKYRMPLALICRFDTLRAIAARATCYRRSTPPCYAADAVFTLAILICHYYAIFHAMPTPRHIISVD